jgi:protein-tyrosine-phosphatase
MAMWFLRGLTSDNIDEWLIESAGVWAEPGYAASRNSQRVVQSRGIRIDEHYSRQIDAQMIADFDLILVMEKNHKEALWAAFPDESEKIFLLSEMIGLHDDVVDPYGGSTADYEATAQEVEGILSQGFDRILELTQTSAT